MDNYPWEEIEVRNVKVIGTLHSDPPERIIVEKGPLGKAVFSFVSGDERKTIVKAHVQAFGNVVKSKRPLRRKHVMEGEDIYLAKVDIRKIPNGSMSDPEKIVGKSLPGKYGPDVPCCRERNESKHYCKQQWSEHQGNRKDERERICRPACQGNEPVIEKNNQRDTGR
jgi:hypothetical protein